MRLSVLDTTLLSNFAHADRPDLLRLALGETAVTTATVLAELQHGEASGMVPRVEWGWLSQVTLTPAEKALAATFHKIVHPGEAECLAVAIERNGRFLSDDLSARRLAQVHGITVSGSIGVLMLLVRQQHIDLPAAENLLYLMKRAGYRAPAGTLKQFLEQE